MFDDPTLWVSLGFILFCALLFKRIRHFIITALDRYIEHVRTKITDASALKDSAQQELINCQQDRQQYLQQIAEINQHAQTEVARLIQQSRDDMQAYFANEDRIMIERIRNRELAMLKSIEHQAINVAIQACKNLSQQLPLESYQQSATQQISA